jgi:hypothetical protein
MSTQGRTSEPETMGPRNSPGHAVTTGTNHCNFEEFRTKDEQNVAILGMVVSTSGPSSGAQKHKTRPGEALAQREHPNAHAHLIRLHPHLVEPDTGLSALVEYFEFLPLPTAPLHDTYGS